MKRYAAACALLLACNQALGIEEALPLEGAGGGCNDAAECDDDNPCSVDACEAGTCVNDPLDGPAAEQKLGDCKTALCQMGQVTSEDDDDDLPDDGNACSKGVCTAGSPTHTPLAVEAPCSQNGGQFCDGNGSCVECTNNTHCEPPETCGGAGQPGACACQPDACDDVGLTCGNAADDGCGNVLDCNNGRQDGDETDQDCGGPTSTCANRCNDGKACTVGTDCASGVCEDLTCVADG